MKMFNLRGVHENGEVWLDGSPCLFVEQHEAENQMLVEIKAYTYNGKCSWNFWIEEVDYEL